MSNKNVEVSSPSPSNQIDDCSKHHPITLKEATYAFIKKQLEYQQFAVHKINDSGIQVAKIQVPGNNESTCLETCISAEDTLNRKKCMDQAAMNFNNSIAKVKEDVTAHSSASRARRLRGRGSIYQKKPGSLRARINYKKSNFHVGIYSTYEEAEAALNKKRQELESVACIESVANEHVNGELMCSDQNPEKQVDVVTNTDVAVRVKRPWGSGSIFRHGGKWQAQIYIRKSKVYVGLYTTYEEAEAAIHKKRQDLDSVTPVEMVAKEDRTTTTAAAKKSMALGEIKNPVTKWSTAEQAFEVLNRERREFALHGTLTNCKVGSIEWKGDETAVATKSQDIESGDCRASVDDVQAPCSMFDTSVINAYGELVGVFSRMDDDLWLVEAD